jgi:hypothetical protein
MTAGTAGQSRGAASGGDGGASPGADGNDGGRPDGDAANGNAGQTNVGGSESNVIGPSVDCKPWPKATGDQELAETQVVKDGFDGKLQRFVGSGLGSGEQGEDQEPLFELADGATLSNVIIGAPAADGIHCLGSCTLTNVWWEDVGEDAATLKGSKASQTMLVDCGGAKHASDKVFQHNGPGTFDIRNFYVEDFGKLYRSCGNCGTQYQRHVLVRSIRAESGKALVGINENYGDTATLTNILTAPKITICQRYEGNDSGDEPTSTGTGPDREFCLYRASDIHAL